MVVYIIDTLSTNQEDIDWVANLGPRRNCAIAWWGYDWRVIFRFVDFSLPLVYRNKPNYWSTDQLNTVLENMENILDNLRYASSNFNDEGRRVLDKQRYREWINLRPSLVAMIGFFEDYVAHNCIIRVLGFADIILP